MHVVTDEEQEAVQITAPKLIIFLDMDDIEPVVKELKDQGIDPSKIQAKPLSELIKQSFILKIEDYDGVTYYSKEVKKFLEKHRSIYVDVNRSQRRKNASHTKRIMKKR